MASLSDYTLACIFMEMAASYDQKEYIRVMNSMPQFLGISKQVYNSNYEHGPNINLVHPRKLTSDHISKYTKYDIVMKLRGRGCPWDYRVYLSCKEFEKLHKNGCPLDKRCYLGYLREIKNLIRLYNLGCPFDDDVYLQSIHHTDAFLFFASKGYSITGRVCEEIIRRDDIFLLGRLLSSGYRNSRACLMAAKHGRLKPLKLLHRYECEWDERVCVIAASRGHLDILSYCIENGCRYNEKALCEAISNNRDDCANYLLDISCPINHHCLYMACVNKNISLCRRLIGKSCPNSIDCSYVACANGLNAIIPYLQLDTTCLQMCVNSDTRILVSSLLKGRD